MKKVLLTTTAVVLTAGWASAGDMSMSGSVTLTYGAFGTGTDPAGTDDFTSEAALNVGASSSGGSIGMTGTLEIDTDAVSVGPVTISSGAFSLTYDKDDVGGGLAQANTATDGEDDNYGDYTIAYSAGGIGLTYTKDQESSDNVTAVTYTSGALSLSMTASDETQANASASLTAGVKKTVIGATYVTGPYTIALSGDDQATQEWDASVAMVSGDTTVTVSADEKEVMKVAIAYSAGAMSVSASQEFNGADDTVIGLSYTDGALTFGAAYDSGQGATAHYGDEAQLVINAAYVDGDVTVAAKGNDQDEMEVSVSFAF